MKILHAKLSIAALKEVVEEFVTRDPTDHSAVKQRVIEKFENGSVELHFVNGTATCNIVQSQLD